MADLKISGAAQRNGMHSRSFFKLEEFSMSDQA